MAFRRGIARYRVTQLLPLLVWVGVLAGVGRPHGPPDMGPLLASVLTALTAVAASAALGVAAGGALAFSPGGSRWRGPLSMSAALPSVVVGAVMLHWLGDAFGLSPGIGLVAAGLALLCLPQTVLLAQESFGRCRATGEAAQALGARPSQAAAAVYGFVRRELMGILLGVAGRALGEAALVALLAQGLLERGRLALQAGTTLASALWYLEITGRLRDARAFWPAALLLVLSAIAAGVAAVLAGERREGRLR
jgi:ABC-type phosphate transport system permease subunit